MLNNQWRIEMKRTRIRESWTYYDLFTAISLIGIALFFVYGFVSGSSAFDWLVIRNDPGEHFKDYFTHVAYVADPKNLYSRATGEWGTFPPFVYMLFYFLFRMTARDGFIPNNRFELMESDHAFTVFLYFWIFVTLLIVYTISIWIKGSHKKRLIVCLLLSTPFIGGGMERANSIMLVIPLLLIALKWRSDDSAFLREMALLLIAFCVGIKIYPAVIGLLYLKECRWKEALRLTIYGFLVFFLPFFCFGGFSAFTLWFSNMQQTIGMKLDIGRVEYIRGLFSSLSYLFSGRENLYLARIMPTVFVVFMLVFAIFSTSQYRTVFYICCIMVFYPYNAHRYTLCYLAIPLIMFLAEHGDDRLIDRFCTLEIVEYALVFTIPTIFGFLTGFHGHLVFFEYATYVELWIYGMAYMLMITVVTHGIYDYRKRGMINPDLSRQFHFRKRSE